jgi:hypothetical protein
MGAVDDAGEVKGRVGGGMGGARAVGGAGGGRHSTLDHSSIKGNIDRNCNRL